ncbi:EthD family reductase [soil metagenome]
MTTFVVTYPVNDGTKFDRDYYIANHMPMVLEKWTKYGLSKATALLPDEPTPAYLAVALLEFKDGAALDRCLASPEAAEIFGDVPAFTDIAPVGVRCEVG